MLRKFICLFLASFVLEGTCFNFTRDRQRRETFNLDNVTIQLGCKFLWDTNTF